MSDKNIPVLDQQNRFLSYTSPAKARILVKDSRATIFSKNPFMLKLKGEIGENTMVSVKKHGGLITNFTKYFSEPCEIYVQNMSSTQISITFPGFGPGGDFHITLPRTKKPYNLTQDVPFERIASSTDFRSLVNRRNPPLLRLIDEDEFIEYYERLADRNGTSFEEEMQKALDIKNNIANKVKLPSEAMQRTYEKRLEDKVEQLEKPEEIHPQIVGLCAQADKDMGNQRMSADDFIDELDVLMPDLTAEDLEFVMTKGVYKKVKKFASDEFDRLTGSPEEDE